MAKVYGLFFVHENGVLSYVTQIWRDRFRRAGYEAESIDLNLSADVARLEGSLKYGEVAFCFGLQGVGSRLTVQNGESLWTRYRTPFLCLHHDSPSCNIYNHFCDSPYVANIYFFQCMYDLQVQFIKSNQINEPLQFEIEWLPLERGPSFQERPIKYVFVKSGQSPERYAENISKIKQPMRDAVWAAVEMAEKNENISIGKLVMDAFVACGLDATKFWREFWGFAGWIEGYIRCKRAADMVNWLKYKDGAVIVGDGWDFIDRDGAKAVFMPSMPMERVERFYLESQFTFNTSPFGRDIIHERVFQGLGFHSFVVSDANQWWDDNFAGVPALYRFHWGADLASSLDEVIHDPHAAEKAMSPIGVQRIKEKLYGQAAIPAMVGIVEKVRVFAG